MNQKNQVFLCHSSIDSVFAHTLANDLIKRGIPVWLSEQVLKVGDSLNDEIGKGIEESGWLIVIISVNSIKSKWVKKELNAALELEISKGKVFVLPAVIDDCEIPFFLRDRVYADFRINYDEGFKSLLIRISPESLEPSTVENYLNWSARLDPTTDDLIQNLENNKDEKIDPTSIPSSGILITDLLKNNQLIITPILDEETQINENEFDFRFGFEWYDSHFWQKRIYAPMGTPIHLYPSQIMTAFSLEYFSIPNFLIGLIQLRGGWERLGLLISTSTKIQPGYKGFLTFEIINQGNVPIIIYPGSRVGSVTFYLNK